MSQNNMHTAGPKSFARNREDMAMGRRFPKLSKIAKEIGDNRVQSVLHAVFVREKKAYAYDHKEYCERIEEVQSRIDHRHGLILELKKLERNSLLDECIAALKAAEHEDFGEVSWLLQRSYAAALRAGEKSSFKKKLKKLM